MITVILGLLGLSIVVLVHEFGHFFAAKAVGVDVEAFSIGWGPKLAGFTWKGTEWRISAFPLGGYCRMKGEEAFKKALEEKLPSIPAEPRSYYGVSPWRRLVILFSGPLANIVLAVFLFSIVSLVGMTINTAPNRIVLASSIPSSANQGSNPADSAGLRSGDIIREIAGIPVRDYSDLQSIIGSNPEKNLDMVVLRDETSLSLQVTPKLDKSTGQGLIGIFAWVDPVIESVEPGSAAAIAGLRAQDRILSVDGQPVQNTIELIAALEKMPERVTFGISRGTQELNATMVVGGLEKGFAETGFQFQGLRRVDKANSLPVAIGNGFKETADTLTLTIKGFGMLFRGVDIFKALSGPARITYFVGSAATESLKDSGASGIPTILSFLAFLSVGLFMMNLLPIPALDGGQAVLCLVEIAGRRPLKTKTIYRYQFVGAAMILAIFVIATFGDFLFFAGR